MEQVKLRILQAMEKLDEALAYYEEDEVPTNPAFPPSDQLDWTDGPGGNLWKPEADHNSRTPGKLVVLLRADWPQFDRVQALDRNDRWENLESSGTFHDGRQVWRGGRPGSQYRNAPKGGGLRLWLGDEFIFFPLEGRSGQRWD